MNAKRAAINTLTAFVLLLLVACDPTGQGQAGKTAGLEAGTESEQGAWLLAKGGRLDASDRLGKVLFINYWATWCTPCKKEIRELNMLADNKTSRVVGIDFDAHRGEALLQAIDELKIDFPVLQKDHGAQWLAKKPQGLPTTLVIDARGVLREVLLGPQTLDTLQQALLRVSSLEYMAETP